MDTNFLLSLVSFGFIVLASRQVGAFFTRFNLPLISGYLLAGIFAGPFVLQFMTSFDVELLLFLDEISLAFIAFAAGSEMYLDELQGRLRSIGWNTIAQLVAIYIISGSAVFFLAGQIPFMQGLSTGGRLAAAILAGTILVARSPSSAIAIINEVRARGPFTKTVLGVTLVIDVLVVILFAVSTSIASALLTGEGFDVRFIILVLGELTASLLVGLLIGRIIVFVLSTHLHENIKIALILLIGYGVFLGSTELRHLTHDNLPFEILLEPLLICMIAAFWLTNRSNYRDEFRYLLHRVETPIFVIFFTLVGESLDIGIIVTILPFALLIFAIRLLGLFIGGYIGGRVANDPPQFNRLSWMVYITQAGVGLGLAKEVAIEFPQLGDDFTTLLVAVIVISQLVGPPFFKYALRQVGEARVLGKSELDDSRDVLIIGIEHQSRVLAERLIAHNWQVILADIDASHVNNDEKIQSYFLPDISLEGLQTLITSGTDAVVAMLLDDDANLRLCEILYEKFDISRVIVHLHDYTRYEQFRALGVQVVYPATAMVHLLDSLVRAPQLATMLLQDDMENEFAQITITDPDLHGRALRDIILPTDVVVIAILRDNHSIVPHGYTILHLKDEVTIIGSPKSIEEVTLKLGF